jgi:hypothetical protein
VRAEPAGEEDGEELDGSARDLHVLRAEGGEAKRGDDDGREDGGCGVGDRAADSHEEEEPCLGVAGGLTGLVGFEAAVLDALAVCGDALAGDDALSGSEEFGGGREVGEEEEGDDPAEDGDGAENYEDPLPAGDGGATDLADGVADEAAENGGKTEGEIVAFEAEGLFGGGLPYADDEDEAGIDACFC